jgi:hypothetical protein
VLVLFSFVDTILVSVSLDRHTGLSGTGGASKVFLPLAPWFFDTSLVGNTLSVFIPSAASHLVAESNTSEASKPVDLLSSPLFALVPAPHIATSL